MATDFTVSLEASEKVEMKVRGVPHNLTSQGALIHMSTLQYDQAEDAIIHLNLPSSAPSLKLTATAPSHVWASVETLRVPSDAVAG
jgi:hypothetical protein